MFRLLRYYSVTSGIAILIVTAVLALTHREIAVRELVRAEEGHNVAFARSFANILWPRFSSFIQTMTGASGQELRAHPRMAELQKATAELATGLPILKLKIYDIGGTTVYSSDPSQMGEDYSAKTGFISAARNGMPASKISHRGKFSAFSGEVLNRDVVESYVPIRAKDGKVEGVFELYKDVTELMARVHETTITIFAIALLAFSVLYGLLFFIVRRADQILKRQYAELTANETELRQAHGTLEQQVDDRTQELNKSEKLLQSFMDNVPSLVSLKGLDGQYLLINNEYSKQFGFNPLNDEGKNTQELFPKELAKNFSLHEHRVLDAKGPVTEEHVIPHASGDHIHFCTKFPISDSSGTVTAIGTISTDITELKRAEEDRNKALVEAEQANQAKSEFLATMSHDLRTPLNAIMGFSDILSGQYYGPLGNEKYREYVEDIRSSSDYLLTMVNSLLDLSAIETGKKFLTKEKLPTDEIIRDCLKTLGKTAYTCGVELVLKVPGDIPPLYGDRRATKQIFLNLLSNAVKFTPQGGKVTVSAMASKKEHTIKIKDTGKGIPAERIPKLTDLFTRGESGAYIADDGWGLGLTITKSLVDLHEGKLDIESMVEKGTTVTVTFPNGAS